nr:FXYD domain-containing ion transport regulator 3 isoform X2 [Peromyscus maniculatus bairdii]
MPMTPKTKTAPSTTVESASASSARSPVTVQGMGHLSSHQALLTTAEDGPVEHSTPLGQVLALEVGLNSKTAVCPLLTLPCLGLILPLS